MSSHGNNLFGFTKDQTRGSFVSMAAETEAPKDNNMTIGDPISQNFSGSNFAQMQDGDFVDMSGWKTFWMSTFKPKKYKAKRLDEARENIDKKYPLEGSCSVLEDRLTKVQDEISKNVYSSGGKGSKRVSERQITALKERRGELKEEKEKECYVDPEVQQQMAAQYQEEMAKKTRKKNIIAYSIMGVLLIGAGVGVYFMLKSKGKAKGKGKKKK
jgi:hypothetical protein